MNIAQKIVRKLRAAREITFNQQLESDIFADYVRHIPGRPGLPKILYYAPVFDYGFKALGLSYEEINFFNTLLNEGYSLIKVDSSTLLKHHSPPEAMKLLRLLAEYYAADYAFCSFVKNDFDLEELRAFSAGSSTVTISWFSDDHWRFDDHSRFIAEAVDLSVTTDVKTLPRYQERNLPVVLSQWACNHHLYKAKRTKKQYDVCFIGQNYGRRAEILESIRARGLNVMVRGRGFPGGKVSFSDMIDLYNRSHICLNLSEALTGDVMQIKGRDFEGSACGSVLLTRSGTGIERYLAPGQECLTYSSLEELPDLIAEQIRTHERLETIANAGLQRVLAEHTWSHRFADIFAHAKKKDWP